MANQPRGRLLQLLIKLQVKANAILLPPNQTQSRFRYFSRRFKELQGIINAIEAEYPGEIDTVEINRYGSNISGLVIYLDSVIIDIAGTYSSGSTSSLSSRSLSSASSVSSVKQRSTSSRSLSYQSDVSTSSSKSSISSRSPSSASSNSSSSTSP